jgi:hypothetical protein
MEHGKGLTPTTETAICRSGLGSRLAGSSEPAGLLYSHMAALQLVYGNKQEGDCGPAELSSMIKQHGNLQRVLYSIDKVFLASNNNAACMYSTEFFTAVLLDWQQLVITHT